MDTRVILLYIDIIYCLLFLLLLLLYCVNIFVRRHTRGYRPSLASAPLLNTDITDIETVRHILF